MQAVILAGGLGTRLAEETTVRPKPMVEIGGRPIIWHIMKIYASAGIDDFIICCGYRGDMIKAWFANYLLHCADVRFDLHQQKMEVLHNGTERWRVTLVDTGADTMTGGRLRRIRRYLQGGSFCVTYGDGLSDVDIGELIAFHRREQPLATLTAVQPPGRFGLFSLAADRNRITHYAEKPRGDGAWVNGGFFVLEPAALDQIDDDMSVWEQAPLERLAAAGELAAYRHYGFWQPMDTLRDKVLLEQLWQSGEAPWRVW